MSLDEASLDHYSHYSHYSSFPRPLDFRLEPSADIIYLDDPTSSQFKTSPDYFPLDSYTAQRQRSIDTMASTQSDEMEAFQRLSDQYQPEVAGPLIGHRQPIAALITEYANADPTYRTKTVALSATYSHYRPIKGDGQCGWRAAIFGYLEQLFQLGDPIKVASEMARLKDFKTSLPVVGFDLEMVEMFMEPTMELLEQMHNALLRRDLDNTFLVQTMNSNEESNSILYYFKILTSTYMQFNANQYEPFLQMTAYDYCKTHIEAHAQEIEQAGLQVLTDGIIAPAGMAVEVLYLDRSEGDEVTPHIFVPDGANRPTIRLLYRPGHYDMIYQSTQPYAVQFQQHAVPSVHVAHPHERSFDVDTLSMYLPNSTFARQPTMDMWSGIAQQPYPLLDQPSTLRSPYQPAPHPFLTPGFSPPHNTTPPLLQAPYTEQTFTHATSPSPTFQKSPGSPMLPGDHQPDGIRLSTWVGEYESRNHQPLAFETGPFKNSPHNPAHFHNADFQPLMWKAEEDYGKP